MNITRWIFIFVAAMVLTGCTLTPTLEPVSTSSPSPISNESTALPLPTSPLDDEPPLGDADIIIVLSDEDGQLFLFDGATRERQILSSPGVYLPTAMAQWSHLIAPVRLSPDGTQLIVPQPDSDATWLFDLEGGAQSKISDQALSATWAADGRQIAFFTPDIPTPEILYVQQVSPTLQPARPLADLEAKIIAAAWSPTGTHIAVAVSTSERVEGAANNTYVEIVLVTAETGAVQSLGLVPAQATSASTWDLAWTDDGQEVWYFPGRVAFSLDEMSFRPLAVRPAPVSAQAQVFSPDGSRIAHVAPDQPTLRIGGVESDRDHLAVTLEGRKPISTLFWVEEHLLLTTNAPNELTAIWHVNPEIGAAVELCDAVYFVGLWPNLIERYTNLAPKAERLPLPDPGARETWLTYTSEKHELSFDYPAEWTIWEDAKTNAIILSNFTFSQPDGWVGLSDEAFWMTVYRSYVPAQNREQWINTRIHARATQIDEVWVDGYPGLQWQPATLALYESVTIPLDDDHIVTLRKFPVSSAYDAVFRELLSSLQFSQKP